MITLETLRKASTDRLLNISALSEGIDLHRKTLQVRIARGTPELSEEEQARIRAFLRERGLAIVSPDNSTNR